MIAIAPHPDDLEITCGGTLAKLVRQGYRVGILDLTSGEPTPRGTPEIRAAEAEAARAGARRARAHQPRPAQPRADGRPRTPLRRRHDPAPHCGRPSSSASPAGRPAGSPDHHQAHLLIEAARFYSQLTKWDDRFDGTPPYRVPFLVYAPFPFDAEVRHWQGTFVIDISDTFEQKMEAVACYRSQFDETRFERIRHVVGGPQHLAGEPVRLRLRRAVRDAAPGRGERT